jgi:CheY-like chemotaxis protein
MAKKILLIENDAALAERLTATLEGAGFETRITGDGKEGLELARDWSPEAIVLCVELPGMSGYLVCQKLKKDDALKPIPLVLTSAEATEETFEKHRTLKARADDYLLKPYEPTELVSRLGALVGMPEGAPAEAEAVPDEEELVSLEEEVGLGAPAGGAPDADIGALDLSTLPDEPSDVAQPSADADLKLLDDAFDGLSAPAEPAGAEEAAAALDELTGEKPVAVDEVDAAAALLPDEDERAARAALDGMGALTDEADAALGALGGPDETLSPGLRLDREPEADAPRPPSLRGASADVLRAAGLHVLEGAAAAIRSPALVSPTPSEAGRGGADAAVLERLEGELAERDAEVRALRRTIELTERRADDASRRADESSRRAEDAETEASQARGKVEAAQEKARKAETDARAGKDEARRATEQARALEGELAELRKRSADAERRATEQEKRANAAEQDARRKAEEAAAAADALARSEAAEREADDLRTELLVARGEAEGARGEVEKRTAELKKRITELEATNAKNEERVVKAYQKIKADEKVRDKVRKALAIAAQLVDDGLPQESAADKERRAAATAATAAAAGGRE